MADDTPTSPPADHPRLKIRKYPNRRYYDLTKSRHLTLEDMFNLIREGYEIEVSDSNTGKDITAKVLAQMILELDSPKLGVFPVAMLHRVLRSNERLLGDFVDRYFNQPLTSFLDQQRNVEQYFRQAMGVPNPGPTVADWAKMMMSPFNPAVWSGKGGAAPAPQSGASRPGRRKAGASSGSEDRAGSAHSPADALEAIQAEIARLKALKAARKQPRPAATKRQAGKTRRGRK